MSVAPRRWTRVGGYSLMAVAGIAAMAWPAPSVRAATADGLVYVWAGMLAIGGLASAIGAALDRWLGEYTGLWPLALTFAVYALSAASSGRASSIAGACALGSIALLLLARWRDVALIRREAARSYAERGRG